MKASLSFLVAAWVSSIAAQAAPVNNWTERTGLTPVSNMNTASPTVGDGTANSADARSIWATIPSVSLAVGDKLTLTGSATLSGIVPGGSQFRWGLFDTNGSGSDTGWLGYSGSQGNTTVGAPLWERNAGNTIWYYSTGSGAATVLNTAAAPGTAFSDGTYNVFISLERTAGGMQIESSIIRTSDSQQFGLHSFLDSSLSTTTFNRAAFLIGSSLDADQVQFSNIDVTYVPAGSDTTGPVLAGTTPADGASFVSITSNLVASFNENIVLGSSGTITIKNLSTATDTVISLPGPDSDGTLSVSGKDLTVDPAVDLIPGDDYAIEISSTAVKDGFGNPYAGILATDNPNWSFTTDPSAPVNPGDRLFGIEFNRNDAFGSPSQSLFRIVSGSTSQAANASSYSKTIGPRQVTVSQPNASSFEFRGANGDSSRAIPGGDTSLSYLVSDFVATRTGAIDIGITNLPAGSYVFRSYHLDTFTGSALGFAQGASTTTPNTIEARVAGIVKDSVQPTSLGTPGLNTTFINDAQIPKLEFSFSHNGISPLTIELRAIVSNGSDSYLLLNGFELFQANP